MRCSQHVICLLCPQAEQERLPGLCIALDLVTKELQEETAAVKQAAAAAVAVKHEKDACIEELLQEQVLSKDKAGLASLMRQEVRG